jgi:hypothetical protein
LCVASAAQQPPPRRRFESFAETATPICTSRNMSSDNSPHVSHATAAAGGNDAHDQQANLASTAPKPHLATAPTHQKKFVTPTSKSGAHSDILCPHFGHVIPSQVLANALDEKVQIQSYFAGSGGLNKASASSARGPNSNADTNYTHAELEGAVYHPEPMGGAAVNKQKDKNANPKNRSSVAPVATGQTNVIDVDSPTQSPSPSVSPGATHSKHRSSKVAEKARFQSPKGHKERNSKEWSLDQTIALLTEVVEGETFIMVKHKKYEERTLVSRAKGIPHGKTNAFWDAIIEKLQSKFYFVVVKGKSQPLFPLCRKDGTPLSLKKDYVSGHFDKLVNIRLAQKERRRSSAGSRSFGVNGDDFETGDGDDSEHEDEEKGKMNGSAAESDDRIKSNKAKQSHIDELLDAYLIQQAAHKADVEAASLFVQEETEQPKAGSKRSSGQENEQRDDALIEDKSNGKGKKKKERDETEKLPKLAMPTHVERSQAASLDHANGMSSGFHALAEAQKPSTVEEFKQKSAALVDQIGKTVAETATQAITAWSMYKNSARACVSEGGLHDWHTLREEPLRMVCRRCGNVIG